MMRLSRLLLKHRRLFLSYLTSLSSSTFPSSSHSFSTYNRLDITGHKSSPSTSQTNHVLIDHILVNFLSGTDDIAPFLLEIFKTEPNCILTHILGVWDLLLTGNIKYNDQLTITYLFDKIEKDIAKGNLTYSSIFYFYNCNPTKLLQYVCVYIGNILNTRENHLITAAYAYTQGLHLLSAYILDSYLLHHSFDPLLLKLTQLSYGKAGDNNSILTCITQHPHLLGDHHLKGHLLSMLALGHLETGRYKEAEDIANRSLYITNNNNNTAIYTLLSSLYLQGRISELLDTATIYNNNIHKRYNKSIYLLFLGLGQVQLGHMKTSIRFCSGILDHLKSFPTYIPIQGYIYSTLLLFYIQVNRTAPTTPASSTPSVHNTANTHTSDTNDKYAYYYKDPVYTNLWNYIIRQYSTTPLVIYSQPPFMYLMKMISSYHSMKVYTSIPVSFSRETVMGSMASYQREQSQAFARSFMDLFSSRDEVSESVPERVSTAPAAVPVNTATGEGSIMASESEEKEAVVDVDEYMREMEAAIHSLSSHTSTVTTPTATPGSSTHPSSASSVPLTAPAGPADWSSSSPFPHTNYPHLLKLQTDLAAKYNISLPQCYTHRQQQLTVGVTVSKGILAFLRGDYATCAEQLLSVNNASLTPQPTPSATASAGNTPGPVPSSRLQTSPYSPLSLLGCGAVEREILQTTLIECYLRMGDLKEAQRFLTARVMAYPNDGHSWYRLIDVYGKTGQYELAQMAHENAVQLGVRGPDRGAVKEL